jgi:hypothetical protein
MTTRSEDGTVDRTVLPQPDPEFRGKIEVAFKDSEAAYPEPVMPPEGAPGALSGRTRSTTRQPVGDD